MFNKMNINLIVVKVHVEYQLLNYEENHQMDDDVY